MELTLWMLILTLPVLLPSPSFPISGSFRESLLPELPLNNNNPQFNITIIHFQLQLHLQFYYHLRLRLFQQSRCTSPSPTPIPFIRVRTLLSSLTPICTQLQPSSNHHSSPQFAQSSLNPRFTGLQSDDALSQVAQRCGVNSNIANTFDILQFDPIRRCPCSNPIFLHQGPRLTRMRISALSSTIDRDILAWSCRVAFVCNAATSGQARAAASVRI